MALTDQSHDAVNNPDREAMDLVDLEKFLDEMAYAPAWRTRAAIEADYYDGNQHTPDDIALNEQRGLPTVTINLVAPTVNLVLGMEARTRTDWIVKSDGSGLTDAQAEGLTAKLNEAERNAYADRACSDAYASAIKTGIGWVEVSREYNPFEYPYRVRNVDRREIWWDMRSQDPLLRDCRWLMRKKWHDVDHLAALLPADKQRFIDAAMSSSARWDMTQLTQTFPYLQDNLIARDWWANDADWRDTGRGRACAYEVWYRVWKRGWVLRFPGLNRVIELDRKNPVHQAALASGLAMPEEATFHKMRLAWWLGPFRLFDMAPQMRANDFPYTPVWGYREDSGGAPYGIVRSMKSLQDEVNARRARMLWQLSAVRTFIDEDAVKDHDLTAAEIARPDAYIRLNPHRRNKAGHIEVQEHQGLNTQQYNVYEDAKRSIQQSAGIYGPMLGDGQAGAEAGVAIDMLIQQGQTGLAEINDNYRLARTAIGTKLLHLVVEDMAGQQNVRVNLPARSSNRRAVVFNRPSELAPGVSYLENDVTKLMWKVALADAPNSPTYRAQRIKDLVEYAKSLPEELRAVFADIVIMASDLPDKEVIADRIRKITGQQPPVDPATATPDELAELQASQQAQAKQNAIQEAAVNAELEQSRAKTENLRAGTAKTRAETIQLVGQMGLVPNVAEPAEQQAALLETDDGAGGAGEPTANFDGEDPSAAEATDIALDLENEAQRPGNDRVRFGAGQ